jgi:sialic acid synthase SpsE/sugar phosphate isomerase/epimerase
LINALKKINDNKSRIVFCLNERGELEGLLTDGDLRRWLTSTEEINLDLPVSIVSNKNFIKLTNDASYDEINSSFDNRIFAIPITDDRGHLEAIALREPSELKIGQFPIGSDAGTFIIAEIGNNHNGSLELARRLVDEAIDAGADCAKFQMRSIDNLYKNNGNPSDVGADLGTQYTLDLLSRFQLSNKDLFSIFDYCKQKGILALCTPWDFESLEALELYGMPAYKVASADLTHFDFLERLARTGKPLICSTGMSKESEIIDAVRLLRRLNASFVFLHCNSTYPAPFKDINLNYLDRLKDIAACPVGYSGHERGISVAIAAVAKGAKIIEKHFTLDREMEGNDHRVSLLPHEFKAMVQGIRDVEQAMGSGEMRLITQGEMMNREVLAKSLCAKEIIKTGDKITKDMIDIKSPGNGLQPNRKTELVGRIAKRDIPSGGMFFLSDIEDLRIAPRKYDFRRPFGIPIRYHDLEQLRHLSNFDLFEFHFSYKDIELDPQQHLTEIRDKDFVVHSPELFSGDHILNLCATEKEYRNRSILELSRIVQLTRNLKKFFPKTTRPLIVVNVGGFSFDGFVDAAKRKLLYELVAESLEKIDQDGVEIIPQTMPPFPWHFGGQRYHNLFVTPDEITSFCEKYSYRICLDVSHSQLAANHYKLSFQEFLSRIGRHAAHLHIVDAKGTDGEGLQIGEGSIDFGSVANVLDASAPNASFIPEIWQGHKNMGEGFWIALERLERWF